MAAQSLDEVLRLATFGWRIFPCLARDKKPLLKAWRDRASSDGDVIRAWARTHEGCNWGVVCGWMSGLWVLDVDGRRGKASLLSLIERHGTEWTNTLTATTGRGEHLYFAHPDTTTVRTSPGKLGAGLDVRGDGAYVIVPPSVHPSGVLYAWKDSQRMLVLAPAWLLDAVVAPSQRQPVPRGEIGILHEGTRNDGLTRLGGARRRKGWSQSDIEAELMAANLRRCRPPLPENEVRKIAASVARYPGGGPDPLETAWEIASRENHASGWKQFL